MHRAKLPQEEIKLQSLSTEREREREIEIDR